MVDDVEKVPEKFRAKMKVSKRTAVQKTTPINLDDQPLPKTFSKGNKMALQGSKASMKILVITVLAVISITGCGVNTTFIYKPSPPAPHGRNLPIKLAVLPFADGLSMA